MVQKNNCYNSTKKHEIVHQIYMMPVRVLSALSQCKIRDTAFLLLFKETLKTNLWLLMSTEIVLLIQLAKFVDIKHISINSNNSSFTLIFNSVTFNKNPLLSRRNHLSILNKFNMKMRYPNIRTFSVSRQAIIL